MDRCRFAVTVVQSDLARSSGPHPIGASRHLPQQAGEGVSAGLEDYFLGAIAAAQASGFGRKEFKIKHLI